MTLNDRKNDEPQLAMTGPLDPRILLRRIAFTALWAYIFSVPLEFSVLLPEPFESFARVSGVAALLSGIAAVTIAGRARRWQPFHWVAISYLALTSISLFWDQGPAEEAEHALRAYFQAIPVLVLSWEFTRNIRERIQMIFAYLLGGNLSALLMMRQAFFLRKAEYAAFRYTIGAWNPNELAIIFAVGLPLALYLAFNRSVGASRLQIGMGWLYLVVASTAILLTGSRTGLVLAVVGFGPIPFLLSSSSRARVCSLLAVFASLFLVGLWLIPAGTWRILFTVGAQVQSGDLDHRVQIWRFGWPAFLKNPFLGSGVGSFRWASGTFYNAHNTYLQVSVEQGVAGLVLILSLIVTAFARLRHATRAFRVTGSFLLITWIVAATVGHLAASRDTWVVFSLASILATSESLNEPNEVVCSRSPSAVQMEPMKGTL
jgi:O-antigen ligase